MGQVLDPREAIQESILSQSLRLESDEQYRVSNKFPVCRAIYLEYEAPSVSTAAGMDRPVFFRPPIRDAQCTDRPWICVYFLARGYAYPGFCEYGHCLSIGWDGDRTSALAGTPHGIGRGCFPFIYGLPFDIDNCVAAQIVETDWSTFAAIACHAGNGTK